MSTPLFTKGDLVWRPVVCSRDHTVRNKLILDIYPHAFDSFGIELLCKRIKDARQVNEINGKKIYALNLEPDVVKIQKVCHNVRQDVNDRGGQPLYFPRPSTFNNMIKMDTSCDYAFFIQLTENVQILGHFATLYVLDPETNMINKKDILDVSIPHHNNHRSMLVLDDLHTEPLSRFLRGAIHGEVRCATRIYRIYGDTIPASASAAIFGPAVGSDACPVYSSAKLSGLSVPVEEEEHQLVAIKVVRKTALKADLRGHERPMDELSAMYHIHHTHNGNYSNIVRLLHCIMEDYGADGENSVPDVGSEMDIEGTVSGRSGSARPMQLSECKNFEGNSYIVMPFYSGGELFDLIGAMSKDYYRVHDCFRQITQGGHFIHTARFNHRDISCENILVHSDMKTNKEEFHVIDFGMSVHIPVSSNSSTSPPRTCGSIRGDGMLYGHRVCGKPLYIPAEHFLEKDPNNNPTLGFPSDVWALGIVLFIILTGTGPFGNPVGRDGFRSSYVGWLREIKYDTIGDRRCPAGTPGTAGRPCLLRQHPSYALLKRMLSWPENDRITLDAVLADDWVRNGGRGEAP